MHDKAAEDRLRERIGSPCYRRGQPVLENEKADHIALELGSAD
jgi:hypothetical protein